MGRNWSLRTIAECAANEPYSTQIGPFGEKLKAHNYVPIGAPVLRGTNVNPDGRFHDDDFVFIDSDWAAKEFDKFVCEADDVILCHKGTLGKIGIIPKNSRFSKYIMGNSMMRVRCDRTKLEPLYLYYWLCSAEGQQYLFSRVSQVGVPQIQRPLSTLREAVLPVPPLHIQQGIIQTLGALDDKIELNRKMNETLEKMARGVFKSWFIDLDPVRAKREGKRPFGMDEDIAALFPQELVATELGEIPKGWRTGGVLEIADLISGGTPKTSVQEYWDGKVMWASAKDVSQSGAPFIVSTERNITEAGLSNSSTKIVPKFSTAIVARGATTGRFTMFGADMAMNQTCYALRSRNNAPFFLNSLLAYEIPKLVNAAHGSVFDTITTETFRLSKLVLPSPELISAYDEAMAPMFHLILSNLHEARTLAMSRDLLLPRLLSGELSLLEAQ